MTSEFDGMIIDALAEDVQRTEEEKTTLARHLQALRGAASQVIWMYNRLRDGDASVHVDDVFKRIVDLSQAYVSTAECHCQKCMREFS